MILDNLQKSCSYFYKKDPDLDILMRTLEFSLPAFICLAIWIIYRPDFATLLFPSIPGFAALAAHFERQWNKKLKAMLYLSLAAIIAQFGCAMLYYQKFLLLCWIFIFTFVVIGFFKNRYAGSAAAGWGLLAVSYTPGYLPGMCRSINLMLGFIIAVLSVGLLSMLTCKYRIR